MTHGTSQSVLNVACVPSPGRALDAKPAAVLMMVMSVGQYCEQRVRKMGTLQSHKVHYIHANSVTLH